MPNRLAEATSPYLLQHKDNPVDWWEWSDAAFEEARKRDVPVLLSVGYAACHWCHVMAHESFEDPGIADQMNRLFVNIKVDREERPDVDTIYMESVQAMTGQGGWPMTVILDHDRRPFFAGTYFPKVQHHGFPAFPDVIAAVSAAWHERRSEVDDQAKRLVDAISGEVPHGTLPGEDGLHAAYQTIERTFDDVNGGWGGAPKFPQQPVIEFLLRIRERTWATQAGRMIGVTLERMAGGGIHDHIGGGFARYSVDARWLVPHFEKMLYDNAQLARLYLWAGIELGRPELLETARTTLDYLTRDLIHPDGGFFSSEDADSEGVEGKFYVWTSSELREILGDDAEAALEYYGASPEGNFEGSNILTVDGRHAPEGLVSLRDRLFEARNRRVRPGLDDKVVASWNGMAIRAFAEAGAALHDETFLDVARRAASFVTDHLIVDGRLMRSWRDGRVSGLGFLEDHASLAIGFYALFSATADLVWYTAASELVDQLGRFARPGGGFYETEDTRGLPKRPVDLTDNPHPSGSALAAEALLMSSLFTGEDRSEVDRALAAAGLLMERHPSMVAHHLSVVDASLRSKELAILGKGWPALAATHFERFRPNVALAPSVIETAAVPLLADRPAGDPALAYVCEGFVCDLPTADPKKLSELLA